jgi:translation initiation factor IF-3
MAKQQKPFVKPKPKPFVKRGRIIKEREHLINDEIEHLEVRIVGEGTQTGVMPTHEALKIARNQGVDLVQIVDARGNNQAVCRIIEYNRYLFEEEKKKKEHAGNKSVLKSIRISPNIGDHDMEVKAKQAHQFLSNNNRVQVFLFFKGREIAFKDQGKLALLKLAQMVEEVGKVEALPTLEGKRMQIMISPKKK